MTLARASARGCSLRNVKELEFILVLGDYSHVCAVNTVHPYWLRRRYGSATMKVPPGWRCGGSVVGAPDPALSDEVLRWAESVLRVRRRAATSAVMRARLSRELMRARTLGPLLVCSLSSAPCSLIIFNYLL